MARALDARTRHRATKASPRFVRAIVARCVLVSRARARARRARAAVARDVWLVDERAGTTRRPRLTARAFARSWMGSARRTQRAEQRRKRPRTAAQRRIREFAARTTYEGAYADENELREALRSFGRRARMSKDTVRRAIRDITTSVAAQTAPVGRTRNTSRDARGRFTPVRWENFVHYGETLETEDAKALGARIATLCSRSKGRKSIALDENNIGAACDAFDKAATIAAKLVEKTTGRGRRHEACFGNFLRGRAHPIDAHTDSNQHGTVIFLLQASGPGLQVPETGDLVAVDEGTAEMVPIQQEIGQAIFLAPNVPHLVPKAHRRTPRVSLVFFF